MDKFVSPRNKFVAQQRKQETTNSVRGLKKTKAKLAPKKRAKGRQMKERKSRRKSGRKTEEGKGKRGQGRNSVEVL